jgi:subtilisin family serine protease/uncharacterized protein YjdB
VKKLWLRAVTLLFSALFSASISGTEIDAAPLSKVQTVTMKSTEKERKYREGEAIILYQNIVDSGSRFNARALTKEGMELTKTYDFSSGTVKSASKSDNDVNFSVALVKSDNLTTQQMIQKLKSKPGVLYAEANIKLTAADLETEPYGGYKWDLVNNGQNGGTAGLDINADQLPMPTNTTEKVVAVIDSGVDYTHEELINKMWHNPFADTNKLKGTHGYDFFNSDDDPMDDNDHGTHVSGAIAGQSDNFAGIAGVAASDNIKIMALKMLGADGSGYMIDALAGYNYIFQAQKLGINVIAVNNSWGGTPDVENEDLILTQLIDLVGANGAISICAAGNDSLDNDTNFSIPTNIDSEYVISIAASDEHDTIAGFSNYGEKTVDIAVPGTNILSSVKHPIFNPTLYENKEQFCSTYYDFTQGELVNYITPVPGQTTYYIPEPQSNVTVSKSNTDFFGKKEAGSASLNWTIKNAQVGETYTIYLPYVNNISQTELYSSFILKLRAPNIIPSESADFSLLDIYNNVLTADGTYEKTQNPLWFGIAGERNWWTHYTFPVAEKEDATGVNRALSIDLVVGIAGDYDIFIDDLGFSKENLAAESFGKYDFFNGTSMATAVATGAVAALADVYPQKTMNEIQAMFLGSIRQSNEWTGKTTTGGILDLSKTDDPLPSFNGVTLNTDGQLQLTGYFLANTDVYMNENLVNPIKSDDNNIFITVDPSYQNKMLHIRIEKNGISQSKDFYCSLGKSLANQGTIPFVDYGGSFVSDGKDLYNILADGTIHMRTANSFVPIGKTFEDNNIFKEVSKIGGNYAIHIDSEPIVSNQKIWAVARLNFGFSSQRQLVSFDLSGRSWRKVADLPSSCDSLTNITLGLLNDVPYLIGGLNEATTQASDQVVYYQNSKWNSAKTLPAARFASKALQTGSKLVVTLGGNNEGTCPVNMIFDGTNWSSSTINWPALNVVSEHFYQRNETFITMPYYTANISLIEKGIVYFGNPADGLGEIYQYRTDNDTLSVIDYSVSKDYLSGNFYAVSANHTYYVLNTDIFDANGAEQARILTMPIQSGLTVIKDSSTAGGTVSGAGTYLPGDKITLQARINAPYFLKRFIVNGKTITGISHSFYAADAASYFAQAITGIYVQKVTLNTTSLNMEYGKTTPLKAAILPSNATDKRILWQTSNSMVATVNPSGVVTAVSKKVGATATITARAADRGNIVATCKVKIIGTLLKKNAKVTVAGLTYKITKSDRANGLVALIGVNNKQSKKVTIPAAIKVNSVSYKVTALEKSAFKKMPRLTNITIKSANLSKIAKGSLSALNKKSVIKVPAKSKKSLQKLVRNAGFKGKIK